jgi:hypothetical protein
MKATAKSKHTVRRPRRLASRATSVKGDIARAMFARWEKDHTDPQPMSWDKFKSKLEENRLREAPLFSK